MGFLIGGFFCDVLQNFLCCPAGLRHMIDSVRRDPQDALCGVQIVLELGGDAGNPVLANIVHVCHRDVLNDPGGVDHHRRRQVEDDDHGDQQA